MAEAVKLNFAGIGGGFEIDEGIANSLEKIWTGNFAELRFGIVEIVDVDAFELEIAEAARKLIFEEARSHAMAAGDEVFRRENAGLDVFVQKIFGGLGGHGAIGSEVAALGANHDFVAGKPFGGELFDGGGDAALAALEAVINGGVDEVDAGFDGGDDGGGVVRIDLRDRAGRDRCRCRART